MCAAARGGLPDHFKRSVGRGDAGEAYGGLVVEDEIGEQDVHRVNFRSCCLVFVFAGVSCSFLLPYSCLGLFLFARSCC